MKRLFAAIKIHPSPKYISTFNELTTSLKHERIKWVEPENMHLTLKFFGETEENKIADIQLALSNAVSKSRTFTLKFSDTGIFGSRYDPRVVWFGINKSPELEMLSKNIITELAKVGWEPDRQNFVPHLTIGRIKELKDKTFFQQIISKYHTVEIQEELVLEVILYESILRREGPLYVKIISFKLA